MYETSFFIYGSFFLCCKSKAQDTNVELPTSRSSVSQKSILDSLALTEWESIGCDAVVSNDGNYFIYTISNKFKGSSTLVVQNTNNTWKKECPGVSAGMFTYDSRQVLFQRNDTLYRSFLGSNEMVCVPNVGAFKYSPDSKGRWLTYQLIGIGNEVILLDMTNEKERHFTSVVDHMFDRKGNTLLLKKGFRKR